MDTAQRMCMLECQHSYFLPTGQPKKQMWVYSKKFKEYNGAQKYISFQLRYFYYQGISSVQRYKVKMHSIDLEQERHFHTSQAYLKCKKKSTHIILAEDGNRIIRVVNRLPETCDVESQVHLPSTFGKCLGIWFGNLSIINNSSVRRVNSTETLWRRWLEVVWMFWIIMLECNNFHKRYIFTQKQINNLSLYIAILTLKNQITYPAIWFNVSNFIWSNQLQIWNFILQPSLIQPTQAVLLFLINSNNELIK